MTMDGGTEIIKRGELWTDGAVIRYIGETPAEMPAFEREIDLDGNLLISNDPFEGVGVSEGKIILRNLPGLGLNIRK